jgi:hypothetical protein
MRWSAFAVAMTLITSATIAVAQVNSDYACREAMNETLQSNAPKSVRKAVLRACKAAFVDIDYKQDRERACDRQAAKIASDLQFPAAYTCTTAMSIAFDQ